MSAKPNHNGVFEMGGYRDLSRYVPAGLILAVMLSTGCGGSAYQYAGYSMDDFFPFDGERTWEYINTDITIPYKVIATLDSEHRTEGSTKIYAVDYDKECLDPTSKDCVDEGYLRTVEWSSDPTDGVMLHSLTDILGKTNFTPPITLAASRMAVGDTVVTNTDGVTFTATFDVIASECPIQWVDTWTDCPKITLDDGGAGAALAGEYYAIGGYNVVAMELTGDTGQWQLLYATYQE